MPPAQGYDMYYMEEMQKQNCSVKYGTFPYDLLLARNSPGGPPMMQALATAVGCPPDLHDKILLLKLPQALVARHSDMKVKRSGKLPPHVSWAR